MDDLPCALVPAPVMLASYRPPEYRIDQAELVLQVEQNQVLVKSRLSMRPNRTDPSSWSDAALVLDGENLATKTLAVNGRELAPSLYEGEEKRRLTLPVPILREGARDDGCFTVETVISIDPWSNISLNGLYASGAKDRRYLCTQCEAEGFRRITWFLDRPDNLTRFRVRIEADAATYPILLANGNRVEAGKGPTGTHYVVWDDPFPKPSYLFAMVAGDLAVVRDHRQTRSGREVAIEFFVEPGQEGRVGHAIASLKRAMEWDERVFGLEYDLDLYMIVAVSDFNMGAMENKGLNIFNAKYVLADPETATDADYANIERVIAHEYFHNWTGNRVTCRDWFQLSLKEGLTVLRDQLYMEDMYGAGAERIGDVIRLRVGQFAEDAGPLAHPVRPESYMEINNFYTTTIYEKGAEIIRMMHLLMGTERFRHGISLYLQRHDGQAATIEDFVCAMEEAGGLDLGQFRLWYALAGTPHLNITRRWDGKAGLLEVTIGQSCPPTPGQNRKNPMLIPVKTGLLGEGGKELPILFDGENEGAERDGGGPMSRVIEVRAREERIMLRAPPGEVAPVLSLMRGFSAPVSIESDLSDEEYAMLSASDKDAVARWDAGRILMLRCLAGLVKAGGDTAGGDTIAAPACLLDSWDAVLHDALLAPAVKARMLTPPSLVELMDHVGPVAPVDLYRARAILRSALALRLGSGARALYGELALGKARSHMPGPGEAEQMGKRALRNFCLACLCWEGEAGRVLAREQLVSARVMTDILAALSCLANAPGPWPEEIFAQFATRWRDNRLVMNKWFELQAASERGDTLARVGGLLSHPQFDETNPNSLYAVIGRFVAAAESGFHDADGGGYRLAADWILRTDQRNPQVAARLLRSFGSWRRFTDPWRAAMCEELMRIARAESLSKDCREIVSTILPH